MFCPKCGNQVPDGVRFCPQCGSSLSEEKAETVSETLSSEPAKFFGSNEPDIGNSGEYKFTPPAPVQKRKKPILPIIIGAVSVTVIAVVAVAVYLVLNVLSPKATVISAFTKSGMELGELFEDSENLYAFANNYGKISASKDYGVTIEGSNKQTVLGNKINSTVMIEGNITKNSASFSYEATSASSNKKQSIALNAYVDEKAVYFELPDNLDGSYSIPFDNIGNKLLDSPLCSSFKKQFSSEDEEFLRKFDVNPFADVSWSAFKKYDKDTVKSFEDSLIVEKSNKTIPNGDKNMKVYRITWDNGALAKVIESYKDFVLKTVYGFDSEDLNSYFKYRYGSDYVKKGTGTDYMEFWEDLDLDVYVGIENGLVKAIHFEGESDGDDGNITCIFAGKGNTWERLKFYADGELIGEIKFKQKDDGFEIVFDFDGKATFVCDDSERKLTFKTDSDIFTVEYGAKDNGCQLNFKVTESDTDYGFEITNALEYSIALKPKAKVNKITDAKSITDMTDKELEDLSEELSKSLGN